MDEIDITQYFGEISPDDLCEIRDHPKRKLVKTNDLLHLTDGGTITFYYVCPECGAEWEMVWHNTTNASLAAIDNCTQKKIIVGDKTTA